MSREIARYVLPEANDGPRECISIQVPTDVNHRAAFWGQLNALGSARVWANDETHAALDAAETWRTIVDAVKLDDQDCHCNEYYFISDFVYCVDETSNRNTRAIDLCDGCAGSESVYFSQSFVDPIAAVSRVGYRFALLADDTPCGVTICEIHAFAFGDVLLPSDWTLQWRDCLDNDHEEYFLGLQATNSLKMINQYRQISNQE